MALNGRQTFTTGRKFAIGANVALASLLAPLVGGLLIYLCFRPAIRTRLDLTSRQAFTLAERTQKVLAELEGPIDVYTCFRPSPYNEAGGFSPGMDRVIHAIQVHLNDLVREFELQSKGAIRLHAFDPNQTGHLTRIGELSRKLGEPAVNLAVVERGERRRVLRMADLAEYDAGTRSSEQLQHAALHGFRDEEALVKALLSVSEERAATVGFLVGHGERSPEAAGRDAAGNFGLSLFARALIGQNYRLEAVDLTGGAPLTRERCDVLVVADPLKTIPDAEVAALVRFAREGGRLLVMLSPAATNALDFPLLDEVFGLARQPHPVCQEAKVGEVRSEPNEFFSLDYSSTHAIVQPLRSKQLRLHWLDVAALRPFGRKEQSEVAVEPIAWSGKDAWLDLADAGGRRNRAFDPGSEQKAGPYVLATAVERRETGGRAVVVGTASVFDDPNVAAGVGNRDLALNAVDWLASREQLISIAPRPFDLNRVDLTPAEFRTIFLYVVVAIPLLALLAGVAVAFARRN